MYSKTWLQQTQKWLLSLILTLYDKLTRCDEVSLHKIKIAHPICFTISVFYCTCKSLLCTIPY